MMTTEGSLPITALLYDLKSRTRFGSGERRLLRVFPRLSDVMILSAGIFPSFHGIYTNTYGISLLTGIV